MKIYEHEGKQYVETGDVSVEGKRAKPGTVFMGMNCRGQEVISTKKLGEWWNSGNKILRLATPEEIAGTEKKMCPAGCGAQYGDHIGDTCPWYLALRRASRNARSGRSWEEYADAHWKEFLPKPVVRLTPESVGKAYRTRDASKAVCVNFNSHHSIYAARLRLENGIEYLVSRTGQVLHESPQEYSGDLISEWDEKAEAAGGEPAARASVGSSEPAGVHAPESDKSSAKPAAQPPSDPAAFYQWLWGFPRPFEVGVPEPVVHQQCACCSSIERAGHPFVLKNHLQTHCPECRGTGLHTGGGR